MSRASEQRIVVGVDGSEGAAAALRWALKEAAVRGASLEAVCAWQFPVPLGLPYADMQAMASVDLETAAQASLASAVEAATDGQSNVPIEQRTVFGHAAEQLLAAAKGATMLVVGTRGRGGFVGLLLGSVSRHCAEHAPCPVVIVPGEGDRS